MMLLSMTVYLMLPAYILKPAIINILLQLIFNYYISKISMTNPFENLNIQDDQDDKFVNNQNKHIVKRTHQERKQHKKQQATTQNAALSNNFGGEVQQRIREDAKMVRNKRAPPPTKGITQGHFHDKRSGTGRVDRPRKEGGGYGNVGNMKDDLNKDKYVKQNEQAQEVAQQQQKPQQPQKLTLAEYYQSKGINLNTSTNQKKALTKNQINAQWIKKEKLTVMQTKQDKRKRQQLQATKKVVQQQTSSKVEQDTSVFLGFGSKPVRHNKQEQHTTKPHHKGKAKVVLNQDDFPSL